MLRGLADALRIPELRRRLLFTAGMLVLFRLGAHIPAPGINLQRLQQLFAQQGNLFNFLDLFVGGALKQFAIFALGVFPYITASIIMSLLQVVFPRLKELAQEEGEAGRRQLGMYTRYLTVVLALFQSAGSLAGLRSALEDSRPLTMALIVVTLTAGTMLLTWMGEIMTEHGVGNGVSLIIFAGIVARLPFQAAQSIGLATVGERSPFAFIFDLFFVFVTIVAVIAATQAVRKIAVQYAKRVVGRRVYGGQATHLPVKLIQAGVIPIIFALSVLQFPGIVAGYSHYAPIERLAALVRVGVPLGDVLYAILIVLFTFFYTAVSFDPNDIAENIKKYGGFVPGIRPGKPTAEYLTRVMERLTLVGGLILAAVAVVPLYLSQLVRGSGFFTIYLAGTSVLIVVGVALETMKQIEAFVLMRHYEGFMK